MNTTEEVTKAPPSARPKRSALARLAARYSGTAVSLALHGTLVLLAFLSVAAPRMGRGGGIVGTANPGPDSRAYSATLQPESLVDASKSPDARVFAPAEPEPEPLDAVPPPAPEDFLAETGIPVAKLPQPSETTPPSRSREAYARLPPSDVPPGDGGEQKGNSPVNGTGGDTGGAGDGTVGAIFMPSPDYPFSARRKGIEGTVVVEIDVFPDGHCENPRIATGSGCDALDDAAVSTIRKWKYEPRPGDAKDVRRVRFVFKLTK